ncbi:MAG: hypothetical protein WCH57_07455 [Verrucomicrobiota bacterium]
MNPRLAPLLRGMAFLAALALPHAARAAWQQNIDTEPGSGIDIQVKCLFDNTPPCVVVPLHITVANRSGQAGTWRFTVSHFMKTDEELQTKTEITVGPGQSRTLMLLAPGGAVSCGNTLQVVANGPAVQGRRANICHQTKGTPTETLFLAMSRDLAARSWEPLKKHIESSKWAFDATQFDPADLVEDWRAYAGVDYLALSETEWARLAPGVRAALRQWVGMGGRLVVTSTAPAAIDWGGARSPSASANGAPYGFGVLAAALWDGKELKPETLGPLLMQKKPKRGDAFDEDKSWNLLSSLGTLKPNTPLILGFVIVFAALVGPVNLFLFAPPMHRHRMFWTTPLLSLGGSLLLIAVITFQEGVGGAGRRFTAIHLLPGAHEAAVIQDQAARTGLLFGSAFRLPEDTIAIPLRLNLPFQHQNRNAYSVEGRAFSGDWFKSRSLQAQRFATIRPTRAELAVVSRDAATGAPVIVSSIESPLETVFLTDTNSTVWRADGLRTGEKAAMRPVSVKEREAWADATLAPARAVLRETLGRMPFQEGHFAALVTRPRTEMLATLPSLRWREDLVFYTGLAVDQTHASSTGAPQP